MDTSLRNSESPKVFTIYITTHIFLAFCIVPHHVVYHMSLILPPGCGFISWGYAPTTMACTPQGGSISPGWEYTPRGLLPPISHLRYKVLVINDILPTTYHIITYNILPITGLVTLIQGPITDTSHINYSILDI